MHDERKFGINDRYAVSNVRLRLDLSTTLAYARFGRDDGWGVERLCYIFYILRKKSAKMHCSFI